MDKGEFNGIVLKEKENRLSISRVPKRTKEEFLKFAEEEFCNDFGMTLKYVWDNFKLWKIFFENISFKLDNILESISQLEPNEKKPEQKENIRFLSGRKVEKGGTKK